MNQSYREQLKRSLIRNGAGVEDYLGFQNLDFSHWAAQQAAWL
jgi:hypothetical protein